MKQALHIFKKDVRYLWRESCLTLMITAILGWAETASLSAGFAEILWLLAAAFLVARVVHAEAIPGHNQFWITRPYRWASLLTAKVLFVLLFVNLPLLSAQIYIVHSANFPLIPNVPGLLWSQVLMLLCFSVPIGAVAVMTSGLAPFLFLTFALLTLGYICSSGVLNVFPTGFLFLTQAVMPLSVWWVSISLAIGALAGFAFIAVYLLYRTRQVNIGRICGAVGAAIAVALYFYTPWPFALAVQSRLSRTRFAPSSLRVAIDPSRHDSPPMNGRTNLADIPLVLPVNITSLGPDLELQADAATVTLQTKEGRVWKSGFIGINGKVTDDGSTQLGLYLLIDPDFFHRESARPLTARLALYVTVFGDAKSDPIPVQSHSVGTVGGLRCGTGMLDQLYCRSAFRWLRSRVYAQFGTAGKEAFTPAVSYSPFPSNLDFNPIERHWVSTSKNATEVTITTLDPLSHFRKDVEFQNIRLEDFANRRVIFRSAK